MLKRRLNPFEIRASLKPSKTVKAAKHYQASSIPAMVQAMLTHLQGVLATA